MLTTLRLVANRIPARIMARSDTQPNVAEPIAPFDVFLFHDSVDKPLVHELADLLMHRGLRVWLEEHERVPGWRWQEELQRILLTCRSAAVLVGAGGVGPWQRREIRLALAELANRALPVIPVLLPGTTPPPELPAFLSRLTWVDLHQGFTSEGLVRLEWNITGQNELSISAGSEASRVVITLHGIRTRAAWQKSLGDALHDQGFTTKSLDFGFFSALQLLWPSARERKVRWFLDQYTAIQREHGIPSVVAHSLGTYLITKAMATFPGDVRFDRMILCGSIVRRDYPWSLAKSSGLFGLALNDYGRRDLWSRLAAWVIHDAGASGTYGFLDNGQGALVQQEREFRHSDYFYIQNYQRRWIPFLKGLPLSALPVFPRGINWKFRGLIAAFLFLVIIATAWVFAPRRELIAGSLHMPEDGSPPIAGALVRLEGHDASTRTDEQGRFTLRVAAEKDSAVFLTADLAGFRRLRRQVLVGATSLTFQMERQ